jgi:hypothetical protein
MSLSTRLSDLTVRIATEFKSIRMLVNGNQPGLDGLTTTAKTSLVSAINEVNGKSFIDDTAAAGTTKTWSIDKVKNYVAGIVNGAPAALDTLKEFADAIGNDANYAATTTMALSNRVRADVATQGLTATQQSNARINISAVGTADIGNPDTNFVTIFETSLA